MRDPYTVLGVARGAPDDEIKRAYRKLAKKLHPDLNPGKPAIEQQFKEITAAYDLLSDPPKRARFDRGEIGPDGAEKSQFRPGGFGGQSGRAGSAGRNNSSFSVDDLVAEFLGRNRKTATASAPATSQKLKVSFLDAARGGKQRVALSDGRDVEVAIPAGIEAGQKLRLKDPRVGEKFLEIEIEPHPLFTRKDKDIHVEVPVTLVEAVLGATITVPTIQGAVSLKVPPGSNSGATMRLKGKGIATGGATGDQYIKLKVTLPDPPDPELIKFLERWSAGHAQDVRGKLDSV
jgi:DnaJ-class molecular chaperone